MVAIVLYAYCKGQRSSRVIEHQCVQDIAYRVIAANEVPDHTTIARFRKRHETALRDRAARSKTIVARPDAIGVLCRNRATVCLRPLSNSSRYLLGT